MGGTPGTWSSIQTCCQWRCRGAGLNNFWMVFVADRLLGMWCHRAVRQRLVVAQEVNAQAVSFAGVRSLPRDARLHR
jgi:hypothetical protein